MCRRLGRYTAGPCSRLVALVRARRDLRLTNAPCSATGSPATPPSTTSAAPACSALGGDDVRGGSLIVRGRRTSGCLGPFTGWGECRLLGRGCALHSRRGLGLRWRRRARGPDCLLLAPGRLGNRLRQGRTPLERCDALVGLPRLGHRDVGFVIHGYSSRSVREVAPAPEGTQRSNRACIQAAISGVMMPAPAPRRAPRSGPCARPRTCYVLVRRLRSALLAL